MLYLFKLLSLFNLNELIYILEYDSVGMEEHEIFKGKYEDFYNSSDYKKYMFYSVIDLDTDITSGSRYILIEEVENE